jgi:hypothetical protein
MAYLTKYGRVFQTYEVNQPRMICGVSANDKMVEK